MNSQTVMEGVFRDMGFPASRAWLSGAVAYSIGRTYTRLVRELERLYGRFGLSVSSFNLLMLLAHGTDAEQLTQHAVGERLVVSPSDLTGLLDRLERRGLVQRLPGPDRRTKRLRITPAGRQLLAQVWPPHRELITRLCRVLGAGEAEQLVGALAKLQRQAA
jgi:MarR family 2-MHQ and catechol resistance regulon transcriptional repressor